MHGDSSDASALACKRVRKCPVDVLSDGSVLGIAKHQSHQAYPMPNEFGVWLS